LDPGGIAAENLALNPLIPNHMEPRDRNCICPTSWRDGEQTGPIRAMCEEDPGLRLKEKSPGYSFVSALPGAVSLTAVSD
jgi:hypothetical protein